MQKFLLTIDRVNTWIGQLFGWFVLVMGTVIVGQELPREWLEASALHGYTVNVTAEELAGLLGMIDDILRPYLVPVRRDVPDGALPAHVGVRAFPR